MKETIISTSTTQQLLSLVRASLWQISIDTRPFKDALPIGSYIDWDTITTMALQQTVAPLAITAALTLPAELLPSKEWQRKAYSFIERNRRTHLLLNTCVAEANHLLKETNIPNVLLKGQAYAQAYPVSTLRQCGDIDLYIGEENYRKAYAATQKFGWHSTEEFVSKSKHYGCTLKGIRIELHRLAAVLPSPKANRKFQEWSTTQLLNSHRKIKIDKEEITLPTPIFDVIFVFLHLYHHFINGGIGLRQVCDWVMLLHTHSKNLDHNELTLRLKEFQLLKAWQAFTPIAVRHLGLPTSECPLYIAKYSKNSDKILSFILREGNFGRYITAASKCPEGYWTRKIYTFHQLNCKMFPRLSVDPWRVLNTYTRTVYGGVRGICLHILRL